jgi:hypothetical protein
LAALLIHPIKRASLRGPSIPTISPFFPIYIEKSPPFSYPFMLQI